MSEKRKELTLHDINNDLLKEFTRIARDEFDIITEKVEKEMKEKKKEEKKC